MVKKVSPDEKALQYIAAGKLKVVRVDMNSNEALVLVTSGSAPLGSDPYEVSFHGEWKCTCMARTMLCVHVRAAQKIISMQVEKPKLSHVSSDTSWIDELLS